MFTWHELAVIYAALEEMGDSYSSFDGGVKVVTRDLMAKVKEIGSTALKDGDTPQ